MNETGEQHKTLAPADNERLEAYKGAVARSRWFLLISLLIACLLMIHTYLEQLSFSSSQTIEVLRSRYQFALKQDLGIQDEADGKILEKSKITAFLEKHKSTAHNSLFSLDESDGLDKLTSEYLRSVEESQIEKGRFYEFGKFDEFIGAIYLRLLTNNGLSVAGVSHREVPLLGITVPANDYVPIMSGMLIVFVVAIWLNVRSLSSVLRLDPKKNALLIELLMLNFTFTGIGSTGSDRTRARLVQALAFWLPFVLLGASVLLDLRPAVSLLVNGPPGTLGPVTGQMSHILFRIAFLLGALGLVLGTTVASLGRAKAIDAHLSKALPMKDNDEGETAERGSV